MKEKKDKTNLNVKVSRFVWEQLDGLSKVLQVDRNELLEQAIIDKIEKEIRK